MVIIAASLISNALLISVIPHLSVLCRPCSVSHLSPALSLPLWPLCSPVERIQIDLSFQNSVPLHHKKTCWSWCLSSFLFYFTFLVTNVIGKKCLCCLDFGKFERTVSFIHIGTQEGAPVSSRWWPRLFWSVW